MLRSTAFTCILLLASAAACGKKGDDGSGKTVEQKTPVPAPALACGPGQLADNGKCVVAVTPQKLAAVKQQKDKLAEVDDLLGNVEVVAGPIELLEAFRQLDAWKKAAASNPKLQQVEQVVITLDVAVKQLRAFRASVAGSRDKLTNLYATLDKAYTGSGAAQSLADLRTQVSAEVKAIVQPLEAEVGATIQKAIVPAMAELTKVADLVDAACAIGKVSGGGDQMKKMCKESEEAFGKALAYLQGLQGKPVTFFSELVVELDAGLGDLVDAEVRRLLTEADARVKAALPAQPPAPAGP